jgi:hypothetical protein
LEKARNALGNNGNNILIVPSTSLPREKIKNSGVGNLLSSDGQQFVDFAKQYWGINSIQLLSEGDVKQFDSATFKPYSGASFSLGQHLIEPTELTKPEYGSLLTQQDINEIVSGNKTPNVVNYENVVGSGSVTELKLRKAYSEFLKNNTLEKQNLRKELQEYSLKNKDWLEPKAIFNLITIENNTNNVYSWKQIDRDLYNTDYVSIKERQKRIEEIKNTYPQDIEFFEFKQFLADKQLKQSKELVHKKGIKLSGDIPYGFSFDEIWANPKAFYKDYSAGFGLRAVNLDSEEGINLLKRKFNLAAQRYDGIRIDMAWAYSNQPLYKNSKNEVFERKDYGNSILSIIEDEIKKVKGKDFNSENVMYEFVANSDDFNIYEGSKLKPFLNDKLKLYCSDYMSDDWGTVSNFKSRGWSDSSYILGATNHDSTPMKIQYATKTSREKESKILERILKMPKESISDLTSFIQAKFAEPLRGKHSMFFFVDALGLSGRYKDNENIAYDYRLKIPENYQDEYFKNLERGEGLNIMDALDKAFVSKELDKTEPELYKEIVKYKNILKSRELSKNKLKVLALCGALALFALGALGLKYINNKKKGE